MEAQTALKYRLLQGSAAVEIELGRRAVVEAEALAEVAVLALVGLAHLRLRRLSRHAVDARQMGACTLVEKFGRAIRGSRQRRPGFKARRGIAVDQIGELGCGHVTGVEAIPENGGDGVKLVLRVDAPADKEILEGLVSDDPFRHGPGHPKMVRH